MYECWLNEKRFEYFDGLRAISILLVILYHSEPRFNISHALIEVGYVGVDLFFVISGFLITTLLIREKNKYGQINLKNFYMRRVLRIFPLYYSLLFFHLFLTLYVINEKHPVESKVFLDNFIYFITYTSNWFVIRNEETKTIFYIAWSLAAEEQFYLFWPPVLYLLAKTSRAMWMIIIVFAISLLFSTYFDLFVVYLSYLPAKIISSIPSGICIGIAASLLLHSRHGENIFSIISRRSILEISIIFLVASYTLYAYEIIPKLAPLFAMGLAVACLATNKKCLLTMLFKNKLVGDFGKVSYGLYLYHMLVLNLVLSLNVYIGLPAAINLFLVIVVSYLVSFISYNYFEAYFLSKKKYFSTNV